MTEDKKIIICLMGPTASGKTDLALKLAEMIPSEIVSVDSAMVYRGLDIGTAKPSAEILQKVPHHLIDIRDPADVYSAGSFVSDSVNCIPEIFSRNHSPLLVGGTMLYFHALQKGIAELPTANEDIRQKITEEAEKLGWQALHDRLKKLDPISAERIHPNDPQRLQRALEVYEITGKTLTELWEKQTHLLSEYQFLNIAIAPNDRHILHQRIEARFDAMLKNHFIDEVKKLFDRGDLHLQLPALRAVGYQQVWRYLTGEFTYDQMRERAIIATRQLAKRQLTWLRSFPNIYWFDSEDSECLQKVIRLIQKNGGLRPEV